MKANHTYLNDWLAVYQSTQLLIQNRETVVLPCSTRFYHQKSNLVPAQDIAHIRVRLSLVQENCPSEETDKESESTIFNLQTG